MKKKALFLYLLVVFSSIQPKVYAQENNIPLPTKAQLDWQQKERIMFIHFGPATFQGREYDNWSSSISNMHLSALNTDQWCEVARSWGAKMVIFVAKHCGGFCWWQTNTTNYSVSHIPWKNGKGDVMKNLSVSCKKYGLDLGVYVYPGDEHWGAGIGSGGITKDPSKQKAYNKIYRQQLTEILSKYGPIKEVWFDGSCHIPVKDILDKYAPDAVYFQGEAASLRWVGNEDGYAPDPNWYSLSSKDKATGTATSLHSDAYGEAYAPVEVDVPFLNNGGHKWFWAPNTDSLLMTKEQLMNIYYKSVGRGSVLLLNSTPDTTGLIPQSHVALYKAFGDEITARFEKPLKHSTGKKFTLEISFDKAVEVNHTIIQEDLLKGQRVLSYTIEGSLDGKSWKQLCVGASLGNKKIDCFPVMKLKKIRLNITKSKAQPQIKDFVVYNVHSKLNDWVQSDDKLNVIGYWEANTFDENEWKEIVLNLTPYIKRIGQYDINFQIQNYDYSSKFPAELNFKDIELEMYGKPMPEALEQLKDGYVFRITRSQQTLDDYSTILKMKVCRKSCKSSGEITIKRVTY
jgi:alpha-L-fucosidase